MALCATNLPAYLAAIQEARMPRRLRIIFPQLPHHIIQRGHSRDAVFFSDAHRVDYLGTLGECRAMFGLRVYAYCLMDNHIHLIVDPRDDVACISASMKRLAGRHSRRLNAERGSSGSLWEGRFKCSVIDTDRYLLTCGRYVDQNPVRAKMVLRPGEYSWSSYRGRAGLTDSPLLDPDPVLDALSPDATRRAAIYRALADVPVPDADLELIRDSANHDRVTGTDEFALRLRGISGQEVTVRKRKRRWRRKPRELVEPARIPR
jgi:putative transposase